MTYDLLWKIHALLMSGSFLTLLTGVIISYNSKRIKNSYKIHRRLGLTGGISAFIALLLAFVMIQISGGGHLTGLHTYVGLAAGAGLITVPILGLSLKKAKNKKLIKRLHRGTGYLTLILMAITILLGLLLTGLIYLS